MNSRLSWNTSYTIYIYENTINSYSTGSFNQADVNSPSSIKQKGFYFTVSSKANVTHYWTSGESSDYYFPYYLTSNCSWTNPSGAGKIISLTLKTSKTSAVYILIQFEYHVAWSEINEPEMTSLCNTITSNGNSKRTLISGYITTATTQATSYISNTASAASVNSGTAGITTQITNYNASNTQLQSDIATQTAIVVAKTAAIATKEQEIASLKDTYTKLITSMNQNANLATSLTEATTSLEQQKASGTTDSATYQTQMNVASENVKTCDGQLKSEASNASTFVDSAESALLTQYSLTDYAMRIESILP